MSTRASHSPGALPKTKAPLIFAPNTKDSHEESNDRPGLPTLPTPPARIDFGSRIAKATFYDTIVGDRQVRPAGHRGGAGVHGAPFPPFPCGPHAQGPGRQSVCRHQQTKA